MLFVVLQLAKGAGVEFWVLEEDDKLGVAMGWLLVSPQNIDEAVFWVLEEDGKTEAAIGWLLVSPANRDAVEFWLFKAEDATEGATV